MKTRNVTLALPDELLRKAKILAAKRETSLSALLAQLLADLVRRDDAYDAARTKARSLMRRGFEMGTDGSAAWTRDELHERERT